VFEVEIENIDVAADKDMEIETNVDTGLKR